jgi:hypothetical protein
MSFFYMRSENPVFDRLNLPGYNPATPVGRINWGHNARSTDPDAEVNLLWDFLGSCVSEGRLCAEDLLCTYADRRVLPLQARAHKIGHMSNRFDPTRTSKVELTKAQVARRVKNISSAKMPENWSWGQEPHNRAAPPELVSLLCVGRIPACGSVASLFLTVFYFVCSFSTARALRTATLRTRSGRRITLIRLIKPATTSYRRRPTRAAKESTTRRLLQSSRRRGRTSRRRPPLHRSRRCPCP